MTTASRQAYRKSSDEPRRNPVSLSGIYPNVRELVHRTHPTDDRTPKDATERARGARLLLPWWNKAGSRMATNRSLLLLRMYGYCFAVCLYSISFSWWIYNILWQDAN